MFVEDDDDEYINLSEVSDEIYRSVDAFSTDEDDYLEFENEEDYNERPSFTDVDGPQFPRTSINDPDQRQKRDTINTAYKS